MARRSSTEQSLYAPCVGRDESSFLFWYAERESNSQTLGSKPSGFACLPTGVWWGERESNSQSHRRLIYSQVGSPVPSRPVDFFGSETRTRTWKSTLTVCRDTDFTIPDWWR